MYYFTVVNRTVSIEEGSDYYVRFSFYFELLFLCYTYFQAIPVYFLLYTCKQYHPNMNQVILHLTHQYMISLFLRMVIITMQLLEESTDELLNSTLFQWCVFLRMALAFTAFCVGAVIVIKRSIATYYVVDYEHKMRRHIGYRLVVLMYGSAFLSGYFVATELITRRVMFSIFIFINVVSFIGTLVIERINKQWYHFGMQRGSSHYNLSERVQVVENIKSIQPFKVISAAITLFSILCVSFVVAEELVNPSIKNWMYIGFNYAGFSYGILLSFIMYFYNPLWQREVKRILRANFHILPSKTAPARMTDILGNNLLGSKPDQTDSYFKQLEDCWNK